MAVNPVSLCADLKAWHSAGLSFLYFPDTDVAELFKAPAARMKEAAAPARQEAPCRAGTPAAQESAVNVAKNDYKKNQQNIDVVSKDVEKKAVSVAVERRHTPVADQPLPEAWRELAARLKAAPVVWTYLELGEDLLVKGSPERSKALKELIGSLGLKGGTSCFLPVTLPGCKQDGSEAWCFEALFERIEGRILVVLGRDALSCSPYADLALEPFREKIVHGRIILCLPSFAELLANPARFEATKVFLRSAFSKINIL